MARLNQCASSDKGPEFTRRRKAAQSSRTGDENVCYSEYSETDTHTLQKGENPCGNELVRVARQNQDGLNNEPTAFVYPRYGSVEHRHVVDTNSDECYTLTARSRFVHDVNDCEIGVNEEMTDDDSRRQGNHDVPGNFASTEVERRMLSRHGLLHAADDKQGVASRSFCKQMHNVVCSYQNNDFLLL